MLCPSGERGNAHKSAVSVRDSVRDSRECPSGEWGCNSCRSAVTVAGAGDRSLPERNTHRQHPRADSRRDEVASSVQPTVRW